MTEKATFEQLLASVGQGDLDKLELKRTNYLQEKTKVQEKLAKINKELQEIEYQITSPIKNAIKAAQLLGIEIPDKYKAMNGNGETRKVVYYWETSGQLPFQAEVSRAMWRLSRGSNGKAGKNGEGVLSAEEFWGLTGLEEAKIQVGDKHTVTLPNGKEVMFQRMA